MQYEDTQDKGYAAAYISKDLLSQSQEYPDKGALYRCCEYLLQQFKPADVRATLEEILSGSESLSLSASPQELSLQCTGLTYSRKPDGSSQEEVAFPSCVLTGRGCGGLEGFPGTATMLTPRIPDSRSSASPLDKLHSMEQAHVGIWHLLLAHFVDTFSVPSGQLSRGKTSKSVAFDQIRVARNCGKDIVSKLYRLAQNYEEYVQQGDLVALEIVPRLHYRFGHSVRMFVSINVSQFKKRSERTDTSAG